MNLRNSYIAQRRTKELQEEAKRSAAKKAEQTGETRGYQCGYQRARAEFSKILTAQPGEHVAIQPPEQPFWRVAIPNRPRFTGRIDEPFQRLRIAEFEFEAERIVIDTDGSEWNRVVLTWWKPVLRSITP